MRIRNMNGKAIGKYFAFVVVFIAICCCINSKVCFAGGLNSNEVRVLGVARGTFEYDGEIYVAKQEYVNQLIAKMSEDDFNLTSEQADKAISNIYANVETGVQEGYIVKIDSPEDDLDRNEVDEITEVSPEEEQEGKGENEITTEEPIKNVTVKENENGTLTVEDDEGNVVLKFEGELKNTGFSIHNTIILIIIIGVLLACVVVYSVKDIIAIRRK